MKIRFLLLIAILTLQLGCKTQIRNNDFPIILQDESAQCGPVCLQMICQYYGRKIDLEKLEKLSGMGDSGTSLLGLSEAAESIGLKSLGVKISYQHLLNEVPLPAIVHWNSNHYVVVYKVTRDKAWVADPVLGKVEYAKKEFCENWLKSEISTSTEGVVLLLEKTVKF